MAAALAERSSTRNNLMSTLFGGRGEDSVFLKFGPPAERTRAIANGQKPYGEPPDSGLSVKEVRRRLSDLVSGAFRAGSMQELVGYLRANLLTLESRSYAGAERGTLHVRDGMTGRSAPAAMVHPVLSERGVRNLAGRDVVGEAPRGPTPTEMRYRDALKVAYRGQPPGYQGWEALKTGLPAALSGTTSLAYTVSNGVGYIGRPGMDPRNPLECTGKPAATRDMLYAYLSDEQSLKGKALPPLERFQALPVEKQTELLQKRFVFDENMAPRTAILLRDKDSLVEAAKVHPDLSAAKLTERFGLGNSDFWNRFHSNQVASRRDDNVVDFTTAAAVVASRRAAPTMERGAPVAEAPAAGAGFGGVAPVAPAAAAIRGGIVIVSDETSPDLRICRHSPDGGHRDLLDYKSVHDLPAGEYRHLVMGATYDKPSGFLQVDQKGGVTFQDAQKREHNLDGPSYEPPPNASRAGRRFAIEGQAMSESGWQKRVTPPGQDVSGSAFGYSSPEV